MPARTHGLSRTTREYKVWTAIKQRCLNPKEKAYPYYGGRGIRICDEWKNSFEKFIEDVGFRPTPNHSIERINNDGDYEPNNVIWATKTEQQHNRRAFNTSEIKGVYKNGNNWCARIQKYGIDKYLGTYKTIYEARQAYEREEKKLYD